MAYETDNSTLRAREQSLGPDANAGRVERRGIGGDRGGMFGRRSGKRRRRIDSNPRAFHRNLRTEADTGTDSFDRTLPGLGGAVRISRAWWGRWRERLRDVERLVRSDGRARSWAIPVPRRCRCGGGRTRKFEGCAWRISKMTVRTPVTPETAAAVRKAADALRAQGFEVEPWRPENLDRIWQYWWNLFGRAGQMAFSPMLDGRGRAQSARCCATFERAWPRMSHSVRVSC